jgi:threonine dehydrogenase-like Zn-dependent dehydrogenase
MSQTGRAALFFGPGRQLEIHELPVPRPEPGAVVIRVTRANICGSDLHLWRGDGTLSLAAPGRQIGHEMTGVVHALGPGVDKDWAGAPLAVGDRVAYQYFGPCRRCRPCLRGMAEACLDSVRQMTGDPSAFPYFRGAFGDYFYVAPEMAIFRVPDHVSDTAVSGVNCALAQVVHGLGRVDVGTGDTVVIQGAGGLGLCATAVARARGADRILVIDGIDRRLELARALGADETVDMREFDTADARVRRVRVLTGSNGADVVCELVGYASAIPEGLRMLGVGGRYLEIGTFYSGTTVEIDPGRLVMANTRIEAVAGYTAASLKQAIDFLARHAGRLPLDTIVADYPLDRINDAFRDQARGKVTRASIVMS